MQKYILILTKAEYVEAFTNFIAHKKRLGFEVDFAIVDNADETFSKRINLKMFVEKKYLEFGEKNFFLLIAGDDKYYSNSLRAEYGDFQYAFSSNPNDCWVYCAVGRFLGKVEEIEAMCKRVIEYETNIPAISTFSIAATRNRKTFWTSKFNDFEYVTDRESNINVVEEAIRSERYNFINFMGHGNENFCALQKTIHFQEKNIPSINIPLHFLAWACKVGCHMGKECIRNHKAITFWGAIRVTYGKANETMIEIFMNKLLRETGELYIGEAYMEAINEVVKCGYSKYIGSALSYCLYGDPSLKIR